MLGTRAGRTSYEKIKACARSLWNKDSVQETVTTVQQALREHAEEAAHNLVQRSKDTHAPADTSRLEADPGTTGANPMDITPEISDEFPDAALAGGEDQHWDPGSNSDSNRPGAGN